MFDARTCVACRRNTSPNMTRATWLLDSLDGGAHARCDVEEHECERLLLRRQGQRGSAARRVVAIAGSTRHVHIGEHDLAAALTGRRFVWRRELEVLRVRVRLRVGPALGLRRVDPGARAL